jgi:glycerol-3-phosphate dehydrogenase (NAD(P)+)
MTKTKVAVIGAGSWGTAVASLAAANCPTMLWARDPSLAAAINDGLGNTRYLSGYALPSSLESSHELSVAVNDATVVVMGVPSHGFRAVLSELQPLLPPGIPIVSLTKGVEQGSLLRMTEVVSELCPGHPVGVLSGPNLAKEVMAGHPAGTLVAFADEAVAAEIQPLFHGENFLVYTSTDVVGAEIAGALKNVLALAAGMCDGLGFGDNSKATLIARGLAELGRLGGVLGGKVMTFGGLAGLGDLVATCTSKQSRNRAVGERLGQGHALADIIAEMNMVAEGVKTARPVLDLAAKHGLEMPIVEQVVRVLEDGVPAAEAVRTLMNRRVTVEHIR